MPKKKQEVKVEPKKEPEEVAEEEEVTCPVCGKAVGMDVLECPHCGAEFEAEEIEEIVEEEPVRQPVSAAPPVLEEEPAQEAEAAEEEEMAECPVCGNSVSLTVASCPYCGAEFEEEEVEEVIEVEEQPEPVPVPVAAPVARPRPEPVVEEVAIEEEPEVEIEEFAEGQVAPGTPSSIADLRVIGVSLVVLGIIGSQIAFFIDWYWKWVPPIEDNLGLFISIPAVVIVAGLLVFMMVKRSSAVKKTKPKIMPGLSLSVFLFGILALVLIMLWDPINTALQDSNIGVGGIFVAVLIVGVLAVLMGQRMTAKVAA